MCDLALRETSFSFQITERRNQVHSHNLTRRIIIDTKVRNYYGYIRGFLDGVATRIKSLTNSTNEIRPFSSEEGGEKKRNRLPQNIPETSSGW